MRQEVYGGMEKKMSESTAIINRPHERMIYSIWLNRILDAHVRKTWNHSNSPAEEKDEDELIDQWDELDESSRVRLYGLSADLETLHDNDRPHIADDLDETSVEDIDSARQAAYEGEDWDRFLELLRLPPRNLGQAEIDYLRGLAWTKLGHHEVALWFFKNSTRLDPNATDTVAKYLECLSHLNKQTEFLSVASMTINPIVYTEKVVRSFLKYQLTAYALADPNLHEQLRQQLSMDRVRTTPLLRGPYISLSRGFREGASIAELVAEGILHPYMQQLIPSGITHVYGHQERAIRSIVTGDTTLVSTGTGSGKTECFLYPIISRCLELKDQNAPPGIVAVIVYPMNALAEDQLERLRSLLAGSGVSFGMYVGKTPSEVASGKVMPQSASRADYMAVLNEFRSQGRSDSVHPFEEVCTRLEMRTAGKQPRILLTNVKQLELLLTRQNDIELFNDARLDFLAFDEAHTFTGVNGAETACLIRRLRAYCGKSASGTTCIATSATIVDAKEPNAARNFASRFFGVPAENVVTVNEEYQRDEWNLKRTIPAAPTGSISQLLEQTLQAVEGIDDGTNSSESIRKVFKKLTGKTLADGDWREALFQQMRTNELPAQIRTSLHAPRELRTLLSELTNSIGRPVSEEELLCYLTLGAASLHDGRPLFRPVVHAFIRGISGAVVQFRDGATPKLMLSSEDELERANKDEKLWYPKLYTCTTCGQHYFTTFLKDFSYQGADKEPGGGQQSADDGATYWEPLDKTRGGKRVVLLNHLVNQEDEASESSRTKELYFCRFCGAAHPQKFTRCCGCSSISDPIELLAVRSAENHPGYLSSCMSCRSIGKPIGRNYREPIREIRAVNVSDTHVLAQDMVQNADRKRLLLFADNRQDAAFQAGWMKDHARRFRLRSLMADAIAGGQKSIGDIALCMSDTLDANEALSRALIPEVWRVAQREGAGGAHADERLYFLRLQILREITMAANQRRGLEPWGRLKIEYVGIDSSAPFIQQWSKKLKLPAEELRQGIETLLDALRRKRLLKDSQREIFSRFWQEGDREIQRGYLNLLPGPQGMKLSMGPGDDKARVFQFLSDRNNLVRSIVRKWNIDSDNVPNFIDGLWTYLISPEVAILVPVTLKSNKDRPLPNCAGVYQIDSSRLKLIENHGYYQCNRCRRRATRRSPHARCIAWQCDGELKYLEEEVENYDLQLLNDRYVMLRPEEHTAMVPQAEREKIENRFKGEGDSVNILVCTPTLELGVDIGALDSVLLRNVPPLPANYWQRAGRAGRRHRMAVTITYCRSTTHDRSYFNEPTRMLAGRVDPPAFNLRNELMITKHVHATMLTVLNKLARNEGALAGEPHSITAVMRTAFPTRIKSYLFLPTDQMRQQPFDLSEFRTLVHSYREKLLDSVVDAFQQGWPVSDAAATSREVLANFIDRSVSSLETVIRRLRRRLDWAFREIKRLNKIRDLNGTLDFEEDAHFKRCDRLIKSMKGIQTRRKSDADGVDDINTFNVLGNEGFLPGYGLDVGAVVGLAEVPFWHQGSIEFSLPRAPGLALREYVPGNLIYANGHKFVARRFHRDADDATDCPILNVHVQRGAVDEADGNLSIASLDQNQLPVISICDVDLVHVSQISDEEENRFQMSVAIYGKEMGRHSGGKAYSWGERSLHSRGNVHFRMVNVGASSLVDRDQPELGYPVCGICGQSVSPLSSARQISSFEEKHTEWCGKKPSRLGFYADVTADAISLSDLDNSTVGYSVMEAIRIAAVQRLDMHIEDLQVLVVGAIDRDQVTAYLWDPMPGGSGLLDQILEHFDEIIAIASEILASCPGGCVNSCDQCLQSFRNSFYHKNLDRTVASSFITECGSKLVANHTIPPTQQSLESSDMSNQPVNDAETKLKHLLASAGFTGAEFQEQIRFKEPINVGHNIGSTTPDVFYCGDPDDEDDKGLCIYLDGLSESIHGNAKAVAIDKEIRLWLKNNGFQVVEITPLDLDDRNIMIRHFKKIAKHLDGKDRANRLEQDDSWFTNRTGESESIQPQQTSETKPKVKDEYSEIEDIADKRCKLLIHALRTSKAPTPEVGFELTDIDGIVIAQCELAWPEKKIAYFMPGANRDAETFQSQSWTTVLHDAVNPDASALLSALKK